MKIALICIAKNEDYYIDEWIKYHKKLGFDDIYVYMNDWICKSENCIKILFNGEAKQLSAYHHFINNFNNKYDFAAFMDVDEFISLKNYKNIKDLLKEYENFYALGINWRIFGSNNLKFNNDYSLINRFTKCSKEPNQHIKTIINLKKCREENIKLQFCDPHSLINSLQKDFTICTDKQHFIHGPFTEYKDNTIQINHYYCKTYEEFVNIKLTRGKADFLKSSNDYNYKLNDFKNHDINEIEDLTAYNFYNDKL